MQQNIQETLQNKLTRSKNNVPIRGLRITYFNRIKYTFVTNILNISERHAISQECSTVEALLSQKPQFTKSAIRSNTQHM